MDRNDSAILIPGMSNEDYHNDFDSISSTGLKLIATKSPGHYKAYLDERKAVKAEADRLAAEQAAAQAAAEKPAAEGGDSEAATEPKASEPAAAVVQDGASATGFGSATHTFLLEPEEFHARYAIGRKFDRRTNKGKADYKAFLAANPNKIFLDEEQFRSIEKIIHNIRRHKMAAAILESGQMEQSIFWTDKETGVRLRIRPDCLSPFATLDLKSTVDASKQGFPWEARRFCYHLSAAMYVDGVFQLTGDERDFVFLAAEKTGPCAVALYPAPVAMLEEGHNLYRKAVRIYAECLEKDQWPLYQPDGMYEEMPWATRRYNG